MTRSYLLSPTYIWIDRSVSTVTAIICTVLTVYHGWGIIKFVHNKKPNARKSTMEHAKMARYRKMSHLFTQLTLILTSLMGIQYALNTWGVMHTYIYTCDMSKKASVILVHLAKCSLYVSLVLRLQVAFGESQMMPKKLVITLYFLTFCFFWVAMIGDSLVVKGSVEKIHGNGGMLIGTTCTLDPLALWGLLTSITFDFSISFITLFAFSWPLKQILKQRKENQMKGQGTRKIVHLLTKYSILTFVAILSTIVGQLGAGASNSGILQSVDNVINSLCLMLMSSWYSRTYHVLCSPCLWLASFCSREARRARAASRNVLKNLSSGGPDSSGGDSNQRNRMTLTTMNSSEVSKTGSATISTNTVGQNGSGGSKKNAGIRSGNHGTNLEVISSEVTMTPGTLDTMQNDDDDDPDGHIHDGLIRMASNSADTRTNLPGRSSPILSGDAGPEMELGQISDVKGPNPRITHYLTNGSKQRLMNHPSDISNNDSIQEDDENDENEDEADDFHETSL